MTELGTKKYSVTLVAFSAILLAFLVVGDAAFLSLQRTLFTEEARRHAGNELSLAERFTRDALLRHDYAQARDALVEWGRQQETLLQIRAVTQSGFVLAAYDSGRSGGSTLTVGSDIDLGGTDSVRLQIVKDLGHYERMLDRVAGWQVIGSVLLTLVFGFALWQILRHLALLPMRNEILRRRETGTLLIQARDELEERVAQRTRQLQEREQEVALLLNSTAEAIFGVDLRGDCTFVNPACVEMLGYDDRNALLGKNIHALIHHSRSDGSSYPEPECPIYGAFLEDEPRHADDEVLWRRDGTSFEIEYWSYPIHSQGGVIGSVVTFLDISERRRTEKELQHYRENLEQEVQDRTRQLKNALDLMAGREARMAELKAVIDELRLQLEAAGMTPCADDPLLGDGRHD